MLNPKKLESLYRLATGRGQEEIKEKVMSLKQITAKRNTEKIRGERAKYSGLYQDPHEAWVRWYEDSKKDISSDNANEVWDIAESTHPTSPDRAKEYLRSQANKPLDQKDPSIAESNLRNEMSQSPDWLVNEMSPKLAGVANVNANQNSVKVKKMYEMTLKSTLAKMNLGQLDPDVASEVHIDELIKLELLGLTDMAQIVNGRFAVADESGAVRPVYSIEDTEGVSEASPNSLEMEMVYSIVPKIAKEAIGLALKAGQAKQSQDNRAVAGAAMGMLDEGMPIEEWGGAMSLMNDGTSGAINRGIAGRAKLGPQTEDQMMLDAMKITDLYGGSE